MLTEEQLQLRKKGIGGSDAAKIAALSRWGTAYDVYQDKLGLSEPRQQTEAMKVGHRLEPMILDYYENHTGNKVKRDNDSVFSKKNPFMLATIDGIVTDKNIIVEAKTSKYEKDWGEEGTCDIPDDYLCQVAHYCAVLNVPRADIIVFFKLSETYKLYHYKRTEGLEAALIKKEKHFWENHVLKQIPPAITKPAQAKSHYKFAEDVQAVADKEAFKKWEKLKKLNEKKKQLLALEDEIKTDLMLKMGVASELVDACGNKLTTWKNVSANRFDTTEFKKTHPDLYKKFTKESHTRRFLTY